jgi:hypothetical protein
VGVPRRSLSEARIRLSDFRYRLHEFRIDVGAYIDLEIFGQGAWNSDWTLASVSLATLGGDGLGRHQQCDVLFNCSPVGPPNVVDLSVPVVDLEAPGTSMALAGTAGTEGWYRSDVVATLSAADNPPGCGIGVRQTDYGVGGSHGTYSGPFTLSTEGVTTVTYRSVDNDDNVEPEQQRVVKLDKTPPVVSGAPTTEANGYGWYKTNVTVHFAASDAVSGVASVTPDRRSRRKSQPASPAGRPTTPELAS